jgi:hypothetical protein
MKAQSDVEWLAHYLPAMQRIRCLVPVIGGAGLM